MVLLKKGEELANLLKLSSDEILLRWVNYQLYKSKLGNNIYIYIYLQLYKYKLGNNNIYIFTVI